MDPIVALIIIEQSIATVVIAAALVVYSRATTRILEAHVEPQVHVAIEGEAAQNTLTVSNNAGCTIDKLSVIISAGSSGGSPYAPRHCLYFGAWDSLAARESMQAAEQPIRAQSFENAQLPNGSKVDSHDIHVEYSFTRRADKRRYSFKYQLGVYKQADGKLMYVRMQEPVLLNSTTYGAPTIATGTLPAANNPLIATSDSTPNASSSMSCIG